MLGVKAYCSTLSLDDSVTVAIAAEYDDVSNVHRFWLGENYRKLWAAPVKMRVLDIQKERGGLTVEKLGGGMQTRSLRLKDPSGREFVLRTIQKYPERGLPENLRPTIAKDILQDQVSTAHPFAALVVPPMAEALSLPHANAEIVYVKDDPGLGEYRKNFADAVYLFEERQPFESTKTDNTLKVQRKAEEDNDTRVDQQLTLRARLLDFLVGDWDRHADNWRWDLEKEKGETIYTPVPRDRDKVFYKTSGVFPWILSHQWLKSNIQPFSETIRDINGWNFNARYFDRYFLHSLNGKEWEKEVKTVQDLITDELIERSVRRMPDTIFALGGEELIRLLKARRQNLMPLALEYYHFLSRYVDIPASAKREFVVLDYLKEAEVRLRIWNKKKDETRGRKLYDRVFDPAITEEIRIYGIGGEDVYEVRGQNRSPVKVRVIGGPDKDRYLLSDSLSRIRNLYIYDDRDSGNEFPSRGKARLRLSADSSVHSFNKGSFKYDRSGPMVMLSYSIDQGFLIRAGLLKEKQGFRKEPYAVKHEFWAGYATGRKSWSFTYNGDFKELIGKNDLVIDLESRGPKNLANYFGQGNNSVFVNEEGKEISYYRNRYDYVTGDVKLKRQLTERWRLEGGLGTEYYTSEQKNNTGLFFDAYNAGSPQEEIYNDRFFAGFSGGLHYDTRDNVSNPRRGVIWNTFITAKRQVNAGSRSYGSILSDLSFYLGSKDSSFVIANRIGGGTAIGDPMFFQQMQLGGPQNLRGFHSRRFTGNTMAYHNLEMRLKLFHFTSYLLPGTVGLIGFNDVGRVWNPGESSSRWHHGYGTGLYISPADLIFIQGVVGFSQEGTLPYISAGFRF